MYHKTRILKLKVILKHILVMEFTWVMPIFHSRIDPTCGNAQPHKCYYLKADRVTTVMRHAMPGVIPLCITI